MSVQYNTITKETGLGKICGRDYDDRLEFLGVRFANAERWKAPVLVESFGEDTYNALEWGNRCYQPGFGPEEFYGKEFYANEAYWVPESEDCLFLNITVPKTEMPEGGYPVAIWYHGGAFNQGYNCEVEFDGESLSKRGVLLVCANYRVNMFGYFCHPELQKRDGFTGNYGLLDQFAALDFIKKHIKDFGGNPDHITIFGQSAGSMSVESMLCSPMIYDENGKSKIVGALLQSGMSKVFGGNIATSEDVGKAYDSYMSANGQTFEDLLKMPAKDLFDWGVLYKSQQEQRILGFNVVNNGHSLIESHADREASGALPKIAYMSGCCGDDLAQTGKTMEEGSMYLGTRDFLMERAAEGNPVYCYYFDHKLPGDDAGAFHSSELWFVFGTYKRCWRPFGEAEDALAVRVGDTWADFFKNGNPGTAEFNGKAETVIVFR